MLAKTHIVAGTAAAVCVAAVRHWAPDPALLLLGGIGGLLPDLDHPQALLTRKTPGASVVATMATATGTVRHRGVLHSILALLGIGAIIEPLVANWGARLLWAVGAGWGHTAWVLALWRLWGAHGAWGLAAGFASHIFVDTWNTTGVQWFWPLKMWVHWPVPNIRVGTWPETVVRWGMIGALAVWHPADALWAAVAAEGVYRGISRAP